MFRNDLTGQRFGRLTVLEYVETRKKDTFWRCRCDCGNLVVVRRGGITSGNTRSCGCLLTEARSKLTFDVIGQRFSRLKVLQFLEMRNHIAYWQCLCDCGSLYVASTRNLRSGACRSCGCLSREVARANGRRNKTHGMSQTRTYKLWGAMIRQFRDGKIQVQVWETWFEFDAFFADMGECPKGHKLARHNPDSHFNKFNCFWTPIRKKEAVEC